MSVRNSLRFVVCSLALFGAFLSPASAQAPEEAAAHAEEEAERTADNDIGLQLTAGGSFAYGNARNFALNLGGAFHVREAEHALVLELGWLFGIASTRDNPMVMGEFSGFDDTTNNFTARARYDYFITPDDAVFAVFNARNDPFANLVPRVGGQVGYLRNLFREENHRFWIEVGVDASYDAFGSVLPISATEVSDDRFVFAWRGFVGYTNTTNDVFTFTTGLEALGEVARAPGSAEPGHIRFAWVNQFRSKIADWLQISFDVTARLDSQPAGQQVAWQEEPIATRATEMFDLLTTLNLVGNFDIDGEPEAELEPEPELACPVCRVCEEPEACPPIPSAVPPPPVEPEPTTDAPADTAETTAETTEEALEEASDDAAETP